MISPGRDPRWFCMRVLTRSMGYTAVAPVAERVEREMIFEHTLGNTNLQQQIPERIGRLAPVFSAIQEPPSPVKRSSGKNMVKLLSVTVTFMNNLFTTVGGVGLHGNRGINSKGGSWEKFPEVSRGDGTSPVLQVAQLIEQSNLQRGHLSISSRFLQQLV